MLPTRATKPEEIVGKIETWERDLRELREIDPDSAELPDAYKKTAFKCMLTQDALEYFSTREEEYKTFEELRRAVMSWAMRKRMEFNQEHSPMDIGEVVCGSHCESHWWGNQMTDQMETQQWV